MNEQLIRDVFAILKRQSDIQLALWWSVLTTTLLTVCLSYIVMRLARIVKKQNELLIKLLEVLTTASADEIVRKIVGG